MQIQVNSGSSINGSESIDEHVRNVVGNTLSYFSDHITRVEVHLSDENGPKGGPDDKRCLIEARLKGRQPFAVTYQAATLGDAIDGAAIKMKKHIETELGRLRDKHK